MCRQNKPLPDATKRAVLQQMLFNPSDDTEVNDKNSFGLNFNLVNEPQTFQQIAHPLKLLTHTTTDELRGRLQHNVNTRGLGLFLYKGRKANTSISNA